MAQCREGWHLEHEPAPGPDPATDTQEWWIENRADYQARRDHAGTRGEDTEDQKWWLTLRAEAQQHRDQADQAGRDTTDFDELITELDDEITNAGIRGKVTPAKPARRHRSTRRRQDTPDLPKRTVSPRTVGKTYTAPDGKTFRPSLFVTLTCPSYGRVGEDGAPADPDTYDYTTPLATRCTSPRCSTGSSRTCAATSAMTCSTSPPSNRSGASPRTFIWRSAAPSHGGNCAR